MSEVFNRFFTFDLEGDARSASFNQSKFPNGCHLDPGTRLWSSTICMFDDRTDTVMEMVHVCKLPSSPRKYTNPTRFEGRFVFDTGIYHETTSHVNAKVIDNESTVGIDGEIVDFKSKYIPLMNKKLCRTVTEYEVEDYYRFLSHIIGILKQLAILGPVYVKPYIREGIRYNYDKLVLNKEIGGIINPNVVDKVTGKVMNCLDNIRTWKPKTWIGSKQIQDYNNNRWMHKAILHNIDDTEELLYRIWEQTKICRKMYQAHTAEEFIQKDFQ